MKVRLDLHVEDYNYLSGLAFAKHPFLVLIKLGSHFLEWNYNL